MNKILALLISTGVISHCSMAEETAEDKRIKELRRQAIVTRNVKRGTLQIKRNVEDIRNRMLLSGVIDQSMIKVVDKILVDAQRIGGDQLQSVIKNLVLALDDSKDKETYLAKASEKQKEAIATFEEMLDIAHQNASEAKVQAELSELKQEVEELKDDTEAAEEKEASGDKISEEERDDLAERQKAIADKAEQIEKDIEALKEKKEEKSPEEQAAENEKSPEEEQTAENEKPEEQKPNEEKSPEEEQTAEGGKPEEQKPNEEKPKEEQTAENNEASGSEEKSIAEIAKDAAEDIEDSKTSKAVEKQDEILAKIQELNKQMGGGEPTDDSKTDQPESESNPSGGNSELAKAIEKQIERVKELEGQGLEGGDLTDSEDFENTEAGHEETSGTSQNAGDEVNDELEKAGEALNNGDLETARNHYEKAAEAAKKGEPASGKGEGEQGSQQAKKGEQPSKGKGQGEQGSQQAKKGEQPSKGKGQGEKGAQQAKKGEGEGQGDGQGESKGKGGGVESIANALSKADYEKKTGWNRETGEYDQQKMQQLLNEAPAEYRDLVKQYYEALARTK